MLTDQLAGGDAIGACGGEGAVGVFVCPQYFLYVLNIIQTEMAITKMAAAVKVEEGRWKLKKDQELSMLVLVFILSATSVTVVGGT